MGCKFCDTAQALRVFSVFFIMMLGLLLVPKLTFSNQLKIHFPIDLATAAQFI